MARIATTTQPIIGSPWLTGSMPVEAIANSALIQAAED